MGACHLSRSKDASGARSAGDVCYPDPEVEQPPLVARRRGTAFWPRRHKVIMVETTNAGAILFQAQPALNVLPQGGG